MIGDNIIARTIRLVNFANEECNSGHLKSWKANGIIFTLDNDPAISQDDMRLTRYVDACLKMEGFNRRDCDRIVTYLQREFA
jgi:hypothetical protein